MRRGRPPYRDILTPREWEVLQLIEDGLTNEQIADRLGINVGTAKYHVGEVLSKLDVQSRADAPAAARSRGQRPVEHAGIAAWLRLRPWWLTASAGAAILVLILAGLLTLRLSESDPPGGLGQAGGDTQGLGPDIGSSPEAGAASPMAPPQCVSGPRADNPTMQSPSGAIITMPVNERFNTIEDAEAWICLDVPDAVLVQGWRILGVTAQRSHSLSQFTQGMGHRRIDVSYIREPNLLRIDLTSPGGGAIEGAGQKSQIMVGGVPATLWTKAEALTVQWEVGGVAVLAIITPAGASALQEAMPLLESIQ
jgi:DNA-binding CsgD family transcriptional regulator